MMGNSEGVAEDIVAKGNERLPPGERFDAAAPRPPRKRKKKGPPMGRIHRTIRGMVRRPILHEVVEGECGCAELADEAPKTFEARTSPFHPSKSVDRLMRRGPLFLLRRALANRGGRRVNSGFSLRRNALLRAGGQSNLAGPGS